MIDKQQAIQKGIKILDSTENSNSLFAMLQTHFPETIKEGQASLKAIATLLGKDLSNMQGYELTFTGKGLANALYTTPCQKVLKLKETFCHSEPSLAGKESQNQSHEVQTLKSVVGVEGEFEREEGATSQFKPLRPLIKENSNNKEISAFSNLGNATQNTLIIGDNLDALKVLKSAYSEKIKMIYIDPPYNTGGDNFIYPDDFRADYKAILREVGLLEIDEEGNEVESETLQFFRNITGSKSHSGWLSFMLPRLKLARDLLREDGVIFISIDDNEQANLKLLCDEIFGEENFVADLIWNNKYTTSNDTDISYQHEHILIYSKDRSNFKLGLLPRTEKQDKDYKNRDNDPKGAWKPTPIHARSGNTNNLYKITFPNGIDWEAPTGRYPRYSKENLLRLYENGELYFNSNGGIDKKTYLNEVRQGVTCGTMWSYDEVGHTHGNNEEIAEILGKGIFNDPKGTLLLKRIVRISTSANSNDIILDFFAGSGTTAQAVMELNVEDKGNRECILVQIDEPINEDKSKVAYDFCKNELGSENPTISDITIERVKRAAKKIDSNTYFNVFTLENKPELISDKNSLKLEISAGLSALDKAINLALSAGKTLSQTLQVVIEDKLYKCEDSYFCIECDKGVLEALAKTSDEYIYLDGFADINLEYFLNFDAQFKERLNIVY